MAVPKQRKTKSRRDQRRMHIFLEPSTLSTCSHCGKQVLPHTVCKNCGYYKGKEVINVLAKLEKKEKKRREQEIKETEKNAQGESAKPQKEMSLEDLSKKKF